MPNTIELESRNTLSIDGQISCCIGTFKIIVAKSNGEPRSDAQSYIRLLEDPQLIVAFVVGQYILSVTAPVTMVLQPKDCNLGEAYVDINTAKDCIRAARADQVW